MCARCFLTIAPLLLRGTHIAKARLVLLACWVCAEGAPFAKATFLIELASALASSSR